MTLAGSNHGCTNMSVSIENSIVKDLENITQVASLIRMS